MTVASKQTIQSVQLLRGLAALAVSIGHAFDFTENTNLTSAFNGYVLPFTIGVDAFFVISGFIMYYTSQNSFGSWTSVKSFTRKRLARIVPLYWLCTIFLCALFILDGRYINGFIQAMLFIPHARPDGLIHPVLGVGWTLNYEMLFYVLFGASLFLSRAWAIAALSAAILALVLSGMFVPRESAELWFWTRPIILEFLAGVFVGALYHRFGKAGTMGWAIAGIALSIAVVPLNVFGLLPIDQFIDPRALQAVILVAACVILLPWALEARVPESLIQLGNVSYALYLIHPIVLRVVKVPYYMVAPQTVASGLIYAAIGIIGSLVAAYLLHHAVERPLTRWLSGQRSGSGASGSPQ